MAAKDSAKEETTGGPTLPMNSSDGARLEGLKIRHFRIEKRLGKGGMGFVYLAHDEKLNRKVALKVLRRDQHFRAEAKARLRREARLLSQLDHPNICRIFDLVEDEHHEFLVLEYIEGTHLRAARRSGLLAEHDEMEIAAQIADALTVAHAHGVVHRDLKPENVILTPEGVIKILDFGIALSVGGNSDSPPIPAKILTDQDADTEEFDSAEAETVFATTEGGAITGTIAYMSPEQARGETITAASDLFSFGLLLQELFTGERAYPRCSPGTLLVRASQANTLPVQGIDPDLETLIERLKSLEPAARPAAQDTADRLEWIRRKPLRKRRRIFLAAAMTVLALLVVFMTHQAFTISREAERANAATRLAEAEAERANREAEAAVQVSDFLADLLAAGKPEEALGKTVTAREILDRGAEKIHSELEAQPQVQARLMVVMGNAYRSLGLFQEAGTLYQESLEIREKHLPPDHPDLIESLLSLANRERFLGNLHEAQRFYDRALELARLHSNDTEGIFRLANTLSSIGIHLWYQGRDREALPLLAESETLSQSLPEAYGQFRSPNLQTLTFVQSALGNYAQAEELALRNLEFTLSRLPPEHPTVAWALHALGEVMIERARPEEAREHLERALEIRKKVLGEDHNLIGWLENAFGRIALEAENLEEAQRHYLRALDLVIDVPNQQIARAGLAQIAMRRGELGEAERLLQKAHDTWVQNLGTKHSQITVFYRSFGELRRLQGRPEEARRAYQQVLDFYDNPEHPVLAETLRGLAAIDAETDPKKAAELRRRADALDKVAGGL